MIVGKLQSPTRSAPMAGARLVHSETQMARKPDPYRIAGEARRSAESGAAQMPLAV